MRLETPNAILTFRNIWLKLLRGTRSIHIIAEKHLEKGITGDKRQRTETARKHLKGEKEATGSRTA